MYISLVIVVGRLIRGVFTNDPLVIIIIIPEILDFLKARLFFFIISISSQNMRELPSTIISQIIEFGVFKSEKMNLFLVGDDFRDPESGPPAQDLSRHLPCQGGQGLPLGTG